MLDLEEEYTCLDQECKRSIPKLALLIYIYIFNHNKNNISRLGDATNLHIVSRVLLQAINSTQMLTPAEYEEKYPQGDKVSWIYMS